MAAEVPQKHARVGERRWPMTLAVLTAIAMQVFGPHGGQLKGWWIFPIVELILLALIIIGDPGRIDRPGRGFHRLTIGLIAVLTVGTLFGLLVLIVDIILEARMPDVTATALLGRGASLWFTNVIVFSLWFWIMDRGGPAARGRGREVPPSFAFPENATPELAPEGWMPTYPDYLYLSFTNATAFSPTDTLPVRVWAKMTMMGESAISLVTAILVIARAINVLPGG
jgi:hypothetical protein